MNIERHILDIIEKGRTKENLYFLPTRQLDRKDYLQVNKVLTCLRGKWNRKLKAHVFEHDISDAIDDVLLSGKVINKQQEFQFFETPGTIVKQLIELAEIEPDHKCLEPSAGHGNIVEALRQIVGDNVTCVEILHDNAAVLIDKGFSVHEGDFLQFDLGIKFDRIVMNPPFTRQQDIIHVAKALSCLCNNGILVSVMSAGVMFRQNKRTLDFWKSVEKYKHERIELPAGSFKVAGTGVNTVILKITV